MDTFLPPTGRPSLSRCPVCFPYKNGTANPVARRPGALTVKVDENRGDYY